MLQRDRSGPQIRDKDNNPNQRKHVSKYMRSVAYGFKDVSDGRSCGREWSRHKESRAISKAVHTLTDWIVSWKYIGICFVFASYIEIK